MKTMFKLRCIIILVLVKGVYNQQFTGNPCTLESSNSPGVCTLLTKCQPIRDDVVFSQKLPQTCGFEGTQVIVCCPKFPRPGDISKKKCREYASRIQNETKCTHKIVKRIVGGEVAGRKEFPHMALIGLQKDSEDIRWLCGGSVISEQYILTTASCLVSRTEGSAKFVLVGVTNINDTSNRQEIKIVERIPHPEYKTQFHYNDIGLVKLEKPIQINSYVRPACLYTNSQITTTKAIATGWGTTEFTGRRSDNLLKVTLNIVDYQFCSRSFPNNRRLKNGIIDGMHVCTGRGTEGKDTCQGDTGGPLQIHHNSDDVLCMYDIVGVTSFGRGCFGGPSVSTRVSNYVKWIENRVWPESTQ